MVDGSARSEGRADGSSDAAGRPAPQGLATWFAASALRIGMAVIGVVVLLYALGRAVGVDLVAMVGTTFESRLGRWFAVAFFGLLLVLAALRGFDTGRG